MLIWRNHRMTRRIRSEEHTSELQSRFDLVCRLLLEKKKDSRIKMFLIQRALRFRREHPDLFRSGEYSPFQATVTFAECCVSFTRQLSDKLIVVILP